jgi:RIP metalloprotease RseP
MSVLAAIAVLAVLIVVHEMGHFLAARLQGIYANRFSIGFGPILWKYQGKQTEYAIRAFPLGGFVGFPDDDPDSKIPPDDPNLLGNRPLLDRAIVISAGVIANLVFAYLMLCVQFGTVGMQQPSQPGVVISGVATEVKSVNVEAARQGVQPGDVIVIQRMSEPEKLGPEKTKLINDSGKFNIELQAGGKTAELLTQDPTQPTRLVVYQKDQKDPLTVFLPSNSQAGQLGIQVIPPVAVQSGIQPGDVILAANEYEFHPSMRELPKFQAIIQESPMKPVQLRVQRNSEILFLSVTPQANADGDGSIGVTLALNGKVKRHRLSGLETMTTAAAEFQNLVNDTINGFGKLIRRFSKVADQVAGPVAIVAVGAKIVESDIANLFQFATFISINLAIINILPLPALDGGHLVFLLLEGLRGKPLPTNVQDGVMQTGLMLLLGLGILLIIRDTANLIPQ